MPNYFTTLQFLLVMGAIVPSYQPTKTAVEISRQPRQIRKNRNHHKNFCWRSGIFL